MKGPFDKGTPSIFVICSPYQVMSAVEAINDLEITDFKIYVPRIPNDPRCGQLENTFKYFKLDFEYVPFQISKWGHRYTALPRFTKYKRAFFGDFRNLVLLHYALRYISNNSYIVALDDGSCTISALSGTYIKEPSILERRMTLFCKYRNIKYGKYFYTKYTDMDVKNPEFQIFHNNFNYLRNISKKKTSESDVYFIGTNALRYITNYSDLSIVEFEHLLEQILYKIKNKYPHDKLFYFAHPNEQSSKYAEDICSNLGIKYVKAACAIEIDILSSDSKPKCIYGFNSTALENLKVFYPDIKVVSFIFSDNMTGSLKSATDYFEKKGVEVELVTNVL